jgi:hypothetical protein
MGCMKKGSSSLFDPMFKNALYQVKSNENVIENSKNNNINPDPSSYIILDKLEYENKYTILKTYNTGIYKIVNFDDFTMKNISLHKMLLNSADGIYQLIGIFEKRDNTILFEVRLNTEVLDLETLIDQYNSEFDI